jgi:hypothetical protein
MNGAGKTNGESAAAVPVPSLVGTDARTGQPVLQMPLPPAESLQRGAAALQAIIAKLGNPAKG